MIWLSLYNGARTVEVLHKDKTYHLVGECHEGKG